MQQKREIINASVSAVSPGKQFIIPLDVEDPMQKGGFVMVCYNYVMNILNVGRKMLQATRKYLSKNNGHLGKRGQTLTRERNLDR